MSSSEEKTLKPSQKKLRDSRQKGQVAQYQDLMGFTGLAVGLGCLWTFLPGFIRFGSEAMDLAFRQIATAGPEAFQSILDLARQRAASLLGGLMGILIVTAVLTSIVVQRGFLFSLEPLTPKLDGMNPVKGIQRIFGVRGLVELAKNLLRLCAGLAVVALVLRYTLNSLVQTPNCGLGCLLTTLLSILVILFLALLFVALIFAVPDILLQMWLFERDQKMSLSEQKRENKDTNGNPEIKGAQRRLRNEAAQMNTKMGIRNATIFIYGGDHAIGLRYVKDEMPVPMVVARGRGPDATARLMMGAQQNVVPHYNDADLARSLVELSKAGHPAPQDEFPRIAEAFAEAGLGTG